MGTQRGDLIPGTLDLLILKALGTGSMHGYGIAEWIHQRSHDVLQVDEGALYPALHRLEKGKLIAGTWKTTGNGRRARFYNLTSAGTKRLEEARANWKTVARGVKKVLRFA